MNPRVRETLEEKSLRFSVLRSSKQMLQWKGLHALPASALGRTVFPSIQMRCYKIHAPLQLIYFIPWDSPEVLIQSIEFNKLSFLTSQPTENQVGRGFWSNPTKSHILRAKRICSPPPKKKDQEAYGASQYGPCGIRTSPYAPGIAILIAVFLSPGYSNLYASHSLLVMKKVFSYI